MSAHYRIVRDGHAGYEVQLWRWWLPVWLQIGINTHATIDKAEAFATRHADYVVKLLGRIEPQEESSDDHK